MNTDENLNKNTDNNLTEFSTEGKIILWVILIIIFGIFLLIGHKSKVEDEKNPYHNIETKVCSNKTSDYYKCSWSYSKNRCICKKW